MVVEYSNKNMNYDKPFIASVAQTPPPIQWYSQYNSQCCRILFDEIHQDVYQRVENTPPTKKSSIPTILKIIGGVIGATALLCFHKNIWNGLKSFVKNLTK